MQKSSKFGQILKKLKQQFIDTINISKRSYTMADFLKRTSVALPSWADNKIGGLLGDLKDRNPVLADALGAVGDIFFPGFGGGTPDYRDNAYGKLIAEKYIQSLNEEAVVRFDSTPSATNLSEQKDWRARLRPKNGGKDQFYSSLGESDYLLRPIQESGGLVWQYTPTIFMSGTANYNAFEPQGANYPINTFINGRAPDIPVTADFTANDQYEARYLLAVMVFLRICTKAYYGDSAVESGRYGTPPPVLLFEYLGDHGFNKVPVVVTNYTMQLPDDVDYVPVVTTITKNGQGQAGQEVTWVPTKSNITINLSPTYTPHKLRRRFNLEELTNGKLYSDGNGGFI